MAKKNSKQYGVVQKGDLPPLLNGSTRHSEWKEVLDGLTPGDYIVYPASFNSRIKNARNKYGKPGEFSILFSACKQDVIICCNKRLPKKPPAYKRG